MGYTNSKLVSYKKISPHKTSPRNHKIDTDKHLLIMVLEVMDELLYTLMRKTDRGLHLVHQTIIVQLLLKLQMTVVLTLVGM